MIWALFIATLTVAAPAQAQHVERIRVSSGSRTNGAIRWAITPRMREMRACLHASARYDFVLRLDIDPAGAVTTATARGNGVSEHGIDCLQGSASSWTFPAAPEASLVRLYVRSAEGDAEPEPAPDAAVAPPPEPPPEPLPAQTTPRAEPAELRPRVRFPVMTANGALTVEQVDRAVRRTALPRIDACHAHMIASDGARAGSVAVAIETRRNGALAGLEVARTNLAEETTQCIVRALRAIRFPSSSATTRVDLTILLDPG